MKKIAFLFIALFILGFFFGKFSYIGKVTESISSVVDSKYIFYDDFETNLDKWTPGGNTYGDSGEISSEQARSGTSSFKVSGGSYPSEFFSTIFPSLNQGTIKISFFDDLMSWMEIDIIKTIDSEMQPELLSVFTDVTQIYISDGMNSTPVPNFQRTYGWHDINLGVYSNNRYKLYIDNIFVGEYDSPKYSDPMVSFSFNSIRLVSGGTTYFDDVYVYTNEKRIVCTQDYTAETSMICPRIFTGVDCNTNDYPSFVADTTDTAICARPGDCVYNNNCYTENTKQVISGENLFCNNGAWWDFDNRKLACEGADSCGNYNIGQPTTWKWIKSGKEFIGEYDDLINPECCGDDQKEYYSIGSDGTSACCYFNTDFVVNGRCYTNYVTTHYIYTTNEKDGWIIGSGFKTSSTTNLLPVGARSDCAIFRSWLDFNIRNIPDYAIIQDIKLILTANFIDNPKNRIITITKLKQPGYITSLVAPYVLWTDLMDESYIDLTSLKKEENVIDLNTAIVDLQNSLNQDYFSLGIAMPNEKCTIWPPTHAYMDFKSVDSGKAPLLLVRYYQ